MNWLAKRSLALGEDVGALCIFLLYVYIFMCDPNSILSHLAFGRIRGDLDPIDREDMDRRAIHAAGCRQY